MPTSDRRSSAALLLATFAIAMLINQRSTTTAVSQIGGVLEIKLAGLILSTLSALFAAPTFWCSSAEPRPWRSRMTYHGHRRRRPHGRVAAAAGILLNCYARRAVPPIKQLGDGGRPKKTSNKITACSSDPRRKRNLVSSKAIISFSSDPLLIA